MALHSSTLAWKIAGTEEPVWLQSMGSGTVEHDRVTSLSLFTFMHWRNGNPLQCSCLENPRDRGAWWAAIYGVAHSQTRLKQLSSSSSSMKGQRKGFPGGSMVKNLLPVQKTQVGSLVQEDPTCCPANKSVHHNY